MLGAMETTVEAGRGRRLGARVHILETTYVLFAHRGVRGVGIDELLDCSSIAKQSERPSGAVVAAQLAKRR